MKGFKFWNLQLILLAVAMLLVSNCKDDDDNVAPGNFTLSSPSNNATDIELDVLLTWQAANDPDGDIVVYDVYLDTKPTPVEKLSSSQAGTSYSPTLTANTTYYWKVVAKDNNENTSSSSTWSFTTMNRGPGEVLLTAPADASTNVALDIDLSWEAVIDPDGDPVTYNVYFNTDATPVTVASVGQTGTSYTPTLAANTTYYWKIIANDDQGGTSESQVWSFTTTNNPPEAVTLIAPADASTEVALASLSWQSATDPDGDPVTYDVYFGTDATPATKVSSGQTSTTYTPAIGIDITYYWKIIAKDNKGGTSESEVWSFTTDIINWTNTRQGTFIDDRDRKVYDVVKIGTQTWFAENLAFTGEGSNITNASTWQNNNAYDGWCYYNNDVRYGSTYGVLYQWEVANDVCPSGWHLPSDTEWTALIDYMRGSTVAGGYLKKEGTSHWTTPNTGASNTGGFTALPGGLRNHTGIFGSTGASGYWWSSTESNRSNAWFRIMYYNSASVGNFTSDKKTGMSIRCIRD